MTEKIPFILNFIGGIVTLLAGALLVVVSALIFVGVFAQFILITEGVLAFLVGWAIWSIIVGIILIYYGVQMENASAFETKRMSRITLLFSILGLVTMVGFFVGPIVSLVGSLMGMTVKTLPQRGRKRQDE